MALVEIVRGLQTTDTTHDSIEAPALKLARPRSPSKADPGFVVNRILLPMINEAFFVLAEGSASATEIDQSMKLGCNHPIGPLALADLVGLDVVLAVMHTIHDEFADSKYVRARCSGNWSLRGISDGKPAGASIAIDVNQPITERTHR